MFSAAPASDKLSVMQAIADLKEQIHTAKLMQYELQSMDQKLEIKRAKYEKQIAETTVGIAQAQADIHCAQGRADENVEQREQVSSLYQRTPAQPYHLASHLVAQWKLRNHATSMMYISKSRALCAMECCHDHSIRRERPSCAGALHISAPPDQAH